MAITTLYREFLNQRRKAARLNDFDTLSIEIEDPSNRTQNIIHKEEKIVFSVHSIKSSPFIKK